MTTIFSPSSERLKQHIEQANIAHAIGLRLRQARERCNLSQNEAARRLGYANSSKLSKIEGATDTNSVPLWLIAQAAKVYEISFSDLFGHQTGKDRAEKAEKTQAKIFEALRGQEMAVFNTIFSKLEPVEDSVKKITAAMLELAQAFDRFVELNPDFLEQPGAVGFELAIEKCADFAALEHKKPMKNLQKRA